jgi:hypothetical protein
LHDATAQADRFAPIILELPASARAAAIGDAYLTARDADVLFYDAAQLAIARGMTLSAGRYDAASTIASLSSATALGGAGGVAIGAQLLTYAGDFSRATIAPRTLGTRGPLAASSLAVTLGGATTWRDTRIGASVKYVDDMRGSAQGGGATADVAIAREVGAKRNVTVALVASNLGPSLRVADVRTALPRRFSLGVGRDAIALGPIDLGVSSYVSLLRDGSLGAGAGAEIEYVWLDGYSVTGRAGVKQADRVGGEHTHGTGTVGLGLVADRLGVDYAYSREANLSVHRVGLRLH